VHSQVLRGRQIWGSISALTAALACALCAIAAPAAAITFGPGSAFGIGTQPGGIVSADFNGDGVPDLAVTNEHDNTVSILLANGSGGFTQGAVIGVGSSPDAIAAGDFQGNGITDLAVANYNDDTVSVLLGDGHGHFTQAPGSPVSVLGAPASLAAGSFGPAPSSIAVLAGGSIVLIGQIGATTNPFAVQTGTIPAVANASALATGSFTSSTYPGLAVLDGKDAQVSILLSDGAGNFTLAPGSPVSALGAGTGSGESITTGNFTSGTHTGVAVGFDNGQASVLLGDGAGGLSLASGSPFQATQDQAISITAGDFNGDGIDDLSVAGYFQGGCAPPCVLPTDQAAVLINNGTGGFAPASGSPYSLSGVADGIASGYYVNGATDEGVASIDFASCHGNVVQMLYANAAAPSSTAYSGDGCPIPTPTTTTQPATGVGFSGATLNGNIDPHFQALTGCHWEYGIGNFNQHASCAFSGKYGDTSIQTALTGLTGMATYQYRLVASTAGGTSYGSTMSFTTCDETTVENTGAALDARGCFLKTSQANVWNSSGTVRINGIDFEPGQGGTVTLDAGAPAVTLAGAGQIRLGGSVTVWGWSGSKTIGLGGTINLVPAASGNLFGFDIGGSLSAKLVDGTSGPNGSGGEARITGTVTLKALGDPVTASLTVTTSDKDGIAGASFNVMPANADNRFAEFTPCNPAHKPPFGWSCSQVESESGSAYPELTAVEPGVVKLLGFIPVEGLGGSFDRSTGIWSLNGALVAKDIFPNSGFVTGKAPVLTFGLTFHGAQLVGGQIGDHDTAIDLGFAEVQDFGLHAQFYPRISLGGDARFGAGPGHVAVQISAMADLEQGQHTGWDFKLSGSFLLQSQLTVAGSVEYDGRDGSNSIKVSGSLTKSYGPISATVGLGGGIGVSHYQITANGGLSAFGLANLAANGIISDAGWGLCATASALIFSGDIGFKHFWSGETDFNGCDFSGLYTLGGPQADVAAPRRSFTLAAGLRREEIAVVGAKAPPRVRLAGPGGTVLATPATPDRFERFAGGYALAVSSSRTTWFILKAPRAGRWTVTTLAGAAPARIERADPLLPLALKASVTGSGSRRVLHWHLNAQRGVTVRFVQDGGNQSTIATTRSSTGKAAFEVASGPAGRRRVIAVVSVDGFPRSQRTAATFAIARQVAPKVRKGSYRLQGQALTVKWRRVASVARYELDVRLTSGTLSYFMAAGTSQTTVQLPAGAAVLSVTIRATGTSGLSGPAVALK
jgi:hypothetical protein